MALVVKDRVKVTTTTTGTGTLTLGSAVTKFQDFSVIGDGNTTYYAIESGNDWEVGIGTYTSSGTTLSRDTILESSNAGSAINLSGTSTVFCTYPAERSVNTADIGTTIQAYDATILKSADIGSTVQGYDADTAKYDDTTANFTGTLQNGGSNVVVDTDIGVTVQAYDADTTKNDVANTFTANQTINGDLTIDTDTLYVDSTNNRVGVGTTTPATELDVDGDVTITGSDRRIFVDDTAAIQSSTTNANTVFRLLPNGTSTISTFRAFNNSDTTDANFAQMQCTSASARFVSGITGTATISPILFVLGSSEKMRIDTSGEVYIAGTTDQGAYNLQCNGTGVWGAGAYVNGSDERIKENIVSLDSGLDVVAKLNPVTYTYKQEWSKDQNTQTGFIAQELLTALDGKNYVDGIVQQGGKYMSVAYQNIIPILTKAIQEQQDIIKALETRIATLENK